MQYIIEFILYIPR